MDTRILLWSWVFACLFLSQLANSLPEPGRWTYTLKEVEEQYFGVPKSLYKGSTVSISVSCSPDSNQVLQIGWMLRQSPCYEEYLEQNLENAFSTYYSCPHAEIGLSYPSVRYIKVSEVDYTCKHFDLKDTAEKFVTSQTSQCAGDDRQLLPSKDDKERKESKADDKAAKGTVETIPQPSARKTQAGSEERSKRETATGSATGTKAVPRVDVVAGVPKTSKNVTSATVPIANKVEPPIKKLEPKHQTSDHQLVVDQDGVYLLIVFVRLQPPTNFTAIMDIKMQSESGYLSAVDWPLLPFYGVMCGVYVIYAIAWLTVSALQWRDLLRIQFWIGGVIFLGLVEKAAFLNEYQSINSTGETATSVMLFAEIISCLKRTLARLLVIIVSLGFGIVKPRLGPALHRIVGVGTLYFVLCTVEGSLRVVRTKNDPSNQTILAEVLLAVLDSAICWWIFSSLVQTTRTLRLRRNVVKLGLYRHFTNALIFSVLASVVYMSWSLYNHRLTNCLTDWKELWVDEAYWHLLFSLILVVIMVLWRPTNNNQRYAFTPLLDALDDDEEDSVMDKENAALNDIYGTKSRNSSGNVAKNQQQMSTGPLNSRPKDNKDDENLKWVEDNIPSSLTDATLPSLLDSDEEIMTVRYERNKME